MVITCPSHGELHCPSRVKLAARGKTKWTVSSRDGQLVRHRERRATSLRVQPSLMCAVKSSGAGRAVEGGKGGEVSAAKKPTWATLRPSSRKRCPQTGREASRRGSMAKPNLQVSSRPLSDPALSRWPRGERRTAEADEDAATGCEAWAA